MTSNGRRCWYTLVEHMRRGRWLFLGLLRCVRRGGPDLRSGLDPPVYARTGPYRRRLQYRCSPHSWAASRLAHGSRVDFRRRPVRRLQTYAALEIVVALLAIALPVVLQGSRPVLAWAYADGNAPVCFAVVRVALSLGLLGLPAAAMGATFPIAAAWLAAVREPADARVAHASRPVTRASCTRSIRPAPRLAPVGAGFWLIPAVGLRAPPGRGRLNATAAVGALWLARAEGVVTPGLPAPRNGPARRQE